MQTYLFYDIETTGLSKSFDQVLQFAAIRTDLNFKEIERHELKIKLNPDVIPSPRAVITHHIGIEESLDGLQELDAIVQIHKLFNTPGTISLGYNTLGFDDEFLRFSFYRNLLTPYTHQYANRCARMDLYPITAMYYLFQNEALIWPEKDGNVSLKLENINNANQFSSGRAHNAMVDVEVTLALAKRLAASKEMWDYLLSYFNKQTDQERIQQLPLDSYYGEHREGLLFEGVFGGRNNFHAPVLHLGEHNHYKNQSLWLRLDMPVLKETTEETIKDNTWVIRKKLGEPGFILPAKDRFLNHLSTDRQTIVEDNKKWLAENPDLLKKIIDYHRAFTYPVLSKTDIDSRLYINGFWSEEENTFCRRFHAASPTEKSLLTKDMKNPQLKMLATRLLGRHYPKAMNETQQFEFAEYIKQTRSEDDYLIDFRGTQRLTPDAALNDITELRNLNELDLAQRSLLDELENYLRTNMLVGTP